MVQQGSTRLNTPSNKRLQPVICDIANVKRCSTLRWSWLALTCTLGLGGMA
jgi:hypothetical protein